MIDSLLLWVITTVAVLDYFDIRFSVYRGRARAKKRKKTTSRNKLP